MDKFFSFNHLRGVLIHLLFILLLLFSFSLFSYSPPSTIHLDMSSKKVPTKRNQLEVIFKAYSDFGFYEAKFSIYSPYAEIISSNFPAFFYFSEEPFSSSAIVSFPKDGLYIVYGNLEDASLLNIEVPEEMEVDALFSTSQIYVKVVEGNAIEITEKQFRHEMEKQMDSQGKYKAKERVKAELEYVNQNIDKFAYETGVYNERFVFVENDLGLELYADNGDIHQKYLEEESIIICPKPKCIPIPFCKRYKVDPILNEQIRVTGKIHMENKYPQGDMGISNHLAYLSVRSYVWLQVRDCSGLPLEPVYTIKSILYPFYTDSLGNIEGTIYAAPPFDGLPYIEYIDIRAEKIYAIEELKNETEPIEDDTYKYEWIPFPYGTKLPNSLILNNGNPGFLSNFYPDEIPKRLNIDAKYTEFVEPRTFFIVWDKRLKNVEERWQSWGLVDECLNLKAGWVTNWDGDQFDQFVCYNFNCAEPIDFSKEYPKPTIFIRPNENPQTQEDINSNFLVKWKPLYPYHESGHWLYFILQRHSFFLKNKKGYSINFCSQSSIVDKNQPGCLTQPNLNIQPLNQFTESFAEAHALQFIITNKTDYGEYRRKTGEIDSKCEAYYWIDFFGKINFSERECDLCDQDPPDLEKKRFCTDNYFPRCRGRLSPTYYPEKYLQNSIIPQMASLLLDIFDSNNDDYWDDRDAQDGGMDFLNLSIPQMISCLKSCMQDVIVGNDDSSNICEFLNILKNCCSISQSDLIMLKDLYFLKEVPADVCP